MEGEVSGRVLRGGACDEFKPMMDRRRLTSTGLLRE